MVYAAVSVLLWTTGEMLTSSLTTTFTANRASDRNRGRYMGMINMAFSTAMIIGPATGTWVYDRYGPELLWIGIGLLGFLLAGATLMVEKMKR